MVIKPSFHQHGVANTGQKRSLYIVTTPPVSIERSDWLKQEGWLNARAAEQNSPAKFVECWIAVQARIDTDGVVKAKTPLAIG